MHGKKVYINKSMYSIQGLKTVSNSLPKGLKKIFKKGGHNYNSIIENWSNLVGKKISDVCYPKSVKTNRELKDGLLIFNRQKIVIDVNKSLLEFKINTWEIIIIGIINYY